MNKHDDGNIVHLVIDGRRVGIVDGQHRVGALKIIDERVLPEYDATVHIGLRTTISHAAIERVDESGERTIEVPKPEELRAASVLSRCLMNIRLRGYEMKAIRKILNLTLADFAKRLDDKAAAETVSRWESEAQPMGSYAEKVLRLFVCEELREKAPGIAYNARMIADLRVIDPWRAEPDYKVPAISLRLIEMKERSGDVIERYNEARKSA